MKRIIEVVLFVFTAGVFASANAATAPNLGPEVINLKMGVMVLPFRHHDHQKTVKDCHDCHTAKIGKIEGWGKETAHNVCIACHELEDKGPSECRQCHKKK